MEQSAVTFQLELRNGVLCLPAITEHHTSLKIYIFPFSPLLFYFVFWISFLCSLGKKKEGKLPPPLRQPKEKKKERSLSRCRRQVLLNWNTNDSSNCILLHLTPRPPLHGSSGAHNTSSPAPPLVSIQCLRHLELLYPPTHLSTPPTTQRRWWVPSQKCFFRSNEL